MDNNSENQELNCKNSRLERDAGYLIPDIVTLKNLIFQFQEEHNLYLREQFQEIENLKLQNSEPQKSSEIKILKLESIIEELNCANLRLENEKIDLTTDIVTLKNLIFQFKEDHNLYLTEQLNNKSSQDLYINKLKKYEDYFIYAKIFLAIIITCGIILIVNLLINQTLNLYGKFKCFTPIDYSNTCRSNINVGPASNIST